MTPPTSRAEVAIIGGGIIGLATAHHLVCHHPGVRLLVIEKEPHIAAHQTGHNSGVLHSGIYYKPGSLKAKNCRAGLRMMRTFCEREGIDHEICGKVVVATSPEELPRLEALHERALANGVDCRLIDRSRLRELEPHCEGLRALHVTEAGIVDFRQVCERLAAIVREKGGRIVTGARLLHLREDSSSIRLETTSGDFTADFAINCAGLHSDRVAVMAGANPEVRIVPFRGEYYDLIPEAGHLCRNLIYPVPDPQFPFLGVHFTRAIGGGVECGPNAVLAFAREGYRKSDINWTDLADALGYRGFRRLALKHWRMGLEEIWRSYSKSAFVKAARRLIPELEDRHLRPAPAGVRAQAVSPDGNMVDDFAIEERARIVHVLNAPSPAATSSLSIGQSVGGLLARRLGRHRAD